MEPHIYCLHFRENKFKMTIKCFIELTPDVGYLFHTNVTPAEGRKAQWMEKLSHCKCDNRSQSFKTFDDFWFS